jgi:hypothetical protein
MKHLLLIAIASIWLHSAQAITVHRDSANNMSYVNVTPVSIPLWMQYGNNATQVKRLYVSLVADNLSNQATFVFNVAGEVVIDSETRNYPIMKSGNFSLTDTAYTNWNANDNTIPFQIIAPMLGFTIID